MRLTCKPEFARLPVALTQAVQLPAGIADLYSRLPDVDTDDLALKNEIEAKMYVTS